MAQAECQNCKTIFDTQTHAACPVCQSDTVQEPATKPPMGVVPEIFWIEDRIQKLAEYIHTCVKTGWYDQADDALSELNRRFAHRKQRRGE